MGRALPSPPTSFIRPLAPRIARPRGPKQMQNAPPASASCGRCPVPRKVRRRAALMSLVVRDPCASADHRRGGWMGKTLPRRYCGERVARRSGNQGARGPSYAPGCCFGVLDSSLTVRCGAARLTGRSRYGAWKVRARRTCMSVPGPSLGALLPFLATGSETPRSQFNHAGTCPCAGTNRALR